MRYHDRMLSSIRVIAAWLVIAALTGGGCDRRVYVVDGVTDGRRFYILPSQLEDDSPVTQSWIAYSLTRSACQMGLDETNPARATAFSCELSGREALVTTWRALRADGGEEDPYLDTLSDVADAGFLGEYVWTFLREDEWPEPEALDVASFEAWRSLVLEAHEPQTRLVGAWI